MGTRAKSSKINVKELFKTPRGKGLAAGLILVLLVLAALFAMTIALPILNSQSAQPINTYVARKTPSNTASKTQASKTTTVSSADTVTGTTTVSIKSDLSNYRDPFEPLVVTTSTSGSSMTGGSTGSDSQSGSDGSSVDVLSLQSIATVGGVKNAVVLYKGQQYTVKAGDKIDSSPFQVTDIGTDNISLLYGDSRLTLQVGDTIVK